MKKLWIYPAICMAGFSFFTQSCKEKNTQSNVTQQKITFKKEGEAIIFKKDSTKITKLDIEIADNDYERETGLMYRSSMKTNQGMLFIFDNEQPRYFYMKNTEISLDIIYLDKDKKVVSIAKNAKVNDETSLPSEGAAQYVLEVNAGLTDTWNIQKGDFISFTTAK
ncbi:DUF192 domain-containing protein [Zhouia sp. PK063]|uniref:DUF192 domain-containing protein n=1 Tax=Zhouia sp. PK063 TaxID=3373602 RepID=UPI0037A591FA